MPKMMHLTLKLNIPQELWDRLTDYTQPEITVAEMVPIGETAAKVIAEAIQAGRAFRKAEDEKGSKE